MHVIPNNTYILLLPKSELVQILAGGLEKGKQYFIRSKFSFKRFFMPSSKEYKKKFKELLDFWTLSIFKQTKNKLRGP
jgi:hypothetical protein